MGIFTKALPGAGIDRRRYPRFESNEPTEVFGADGGESLSPGLIRDISSGGACIAVEKELGAGRRVQFRCSLGVMTAIIRHCSPVPRGYLIGVEFPSPVSLGADLRRTLPAAW